MSPLQHIPVQISGYAIVPLILPSLPSCPVTAMHYIYLAPHQPRIPTPTARRSLFLVNVPFDSSDLQIKRLLSRQLELPNGRIEDVHFEVERKEGTGTVKPATVELKTEKKGKKRKRGSGGQSIEQLEDTTLPSTWDRELQSNGRTAVVVFVDRSSMEACLKAVKKLRKERKELVWGGSLAEKLPSLGSARYLNHHKLRFPDKTQLLESVNMYMTAFAAQEAAQSRLQARQRQEPDEDGFITVTRGGRTGPARQEVANEQAEKQEQKQKGLEDFYRFQSREKRKARAGELVKKFEEDKEKVKRMRERRGRLKPE